MKKIIQNIYEVDANSPFQTFRAGCDLEETFRAIKLTSEGIFPTELGDIPCGILMSKLGKRGDEVYCLCAGGGLWELGQDVEAGDLLTAGDEGLAIKCVEGDFIFARALEKGKAGAVIHVVITNAGFISIFFDEEEEDWDLVKWFYGFPISRRRRYRAVSYPNPKEGITKEELVEVGNYAVDNKIITNASGEIADKLIGIALKRKEIEIIRL